MSAGLALRVLFLGTGGELSARALRAIATEHRLVGIVRAQPAAAGTATAPLRRLAGRVLRAVRRDPLAAAAPAVRAPVHTFAAPDASRLAALARRARADLLCVAGFPWLLAREVCDAAPLGAINLHASLLPRHRGVLPLFWIYYHDDRTTGVTVHRIDDGADTGDVLAQESFPLPRGHDVDALARTNAERGAALLRAVVVSLVAGTAVAEPQDHARATHAPRPRGGPMVDFARWDVERVWHFLAGLQSRYREPLCDDAGEPVSYACVRGWERTGHGRAPGTVVLRAGGYVLHCLNGIVRLERATGRGRRR